MGPVAARFPDGRLHLQHGPIDLIIGAEAAQTAAASAGADQDRAFAAAQARFDGLLEDLVAELPLLRRRQTATSPQPQGAVARRMYAAAQPHAAAQFVTPMIAVAGAVADAVLQAMLEAAPLTRAYVNNGGDIALHLAPGARFRLALACPKGQDLGRLDLTESCGVATSGAGGRSLSLGIADAVTVVAPSAAQADAAATLIANAVDLPGHPGIQRRPACDVQPDSDLGSQPVVTAVAPLAPPQIQTALARGKTRAQALLGQGQILGAALALQGEMTILGAGFALPHPEKETALA